MKLLLGKYCMPSTTLEIMPNSQISENAGQVSEGTLMIKNLIFSSYYDPDIEENPKECDRIHLAVEDDSYSGHRVTSDEATAAANSDNGWDYIAHIMAQEAGYYPGTYDYLKYQGVFIAGFNGIDSEMQTSPTAGSFLHLPKMLYSGIIMGVDQQDAGTSNKMRYKIFKCKIASSAQCLTRIYCDLSFPQGASITQILFGNHSSDSWYNNALYQFSGLVQTRINPEGFFDFGLSCTTDNIINNTVLASDANLWGTTIADALDKLAKSGEAYWNVDAYDVFRFRRNGLTGSAPFTLDTQAEAYNVQPTRDSYTTYSAIRFTGGRGEGAPFYAYAYSKEDDKFKRQSMVVTDSTHAKLEYPLSRLYQGNSSDTTGTYCFTQYNKTDDSLYWYPCYFSGIQTPPEGTKACVVSTDSDTIELVNGLTFDFLPNNIPDTQNFSAESYAFLSYIPIIDIIVRLTDPDLQEQVKEQGGGTGIIEYTYSDNAITNYSEATQEAISVLDSVSRRTLTIKFKTLKEGFHCGQTLRANLPYYGATETYMVTAVTASLIYARDEEANAILWEYEVEATVGAYRDAVTHLFLVPTSTKFSLGSSSPPTKGLYLNYQLGFWTQISAVPCGPLSWEEWEYQKNTWTEIENSGKTWTDWLYPTVDVSSRDFGPNDDYQQRWSNVGMLYLQEALMGSTSPVNGNLACLKQITLTDVSGATDIIQATSPVGASGRSGFRVVNEFLFNVPSSRHYTKIELDNSSGVPVMAAVCDIDGTTAGPFYGRYCDIKIDMLMGAGERTLGFSASAILAESLQIALSNPERGMENALRSSDIYWFWVGNHEAEEGNFLTNIFDVTGDIWLTGTPGDPNWLSVQRAADPLRTEDSIITTYYVPPTTYKVIHQISTDNPWKEVSTVLDYNKSETAPEGPYTLVIVKRERL